MTEDKGEITRRDFLIKSLKGAGAFALAGIMSKGNKELFGKDDPEFDDIGPDFPLTLLSGKSAESIELHIDSFTTDRKPKLRKENGTYVAKGFEDGTETVRMLSEITDFSLYKVKINDSLVDDGKVKNYRSPIGFLNGDSGGYFPNDRTMFGIKVIVAPCNYFLDTKLPEEKNQKPSILDRVYSFGEGFLVGELRQINGKNVLDQTRYVCDARALKIIE